MKLPAITTRAPLGMLIVLALTLSFTAISLATDVKAACAHDLSGRCGPVEDGVISYREAFPGEGVAGYKQHEGDDGHLPRTRSGLASLVGKVELDDRGAGLTGRIADVAAHGEWAYLAAFLSPSCQEGGVHVVNISNPSAPREDVNAFIPTSEGSYVGEGVKVIDIGPRDVLIHQNETCDFATTAPTGGISLWDVTNPRDPQPLALHQGDFTNPNGGTDPVPNDSHSFDAWHDDNTGRTYAALIDNEETTDVDILDISDPRTPVLINDTIDLIDETMQDSPETLTSVFSHDMDVTKFRDRYIMTLNYWDGGYVLLDVSNPLNITLLAETDFAEFDEERAKRGEFVPPEGNAHQSEISPSHDFMVGTDEDFNPFRLTVTIEDGPNAGESLAATQASDTPAITDETPVSGGTEFVGQACEALTPAPDDATVALVERGVCTFQVKIDNVAAAGYSAGIVFNDLRTDCLARVNMLAEGDIPFVFVNRVGGLQILNQAVEGQEACTQASPAPGSDSAAVTLASVFDGWGYVRLFSADMGQRFVERSGDLTQIDTYAVPESQDPDFATGFGDLSVHEVAMDPRDNGLAYISYYSAGFRVVAYGEDGIREVGAYIDDGGSNLWGVEVHKIRGRFYVLASDRDYGLYIFDVPCQDRGSGPRCDRFQP